VAFTAEFRGGSEFPWRRSTFTVVPRLISSVSTSFPMKERWHGFYATRIYLPCSSFAKKCRRVLAQITGKKKKFAQETRLPRVSWKQCVGKHSITIWEHQKQNGNVRISELGILAGLASGCVNNSNIFEIGTFDGRTTLNLAMNSPQLCKVFTLDLPPDVETKFAIADGERHMVEKPRSGSRYEKNRTNFPDSVKKITQLYGDSAAFDYLPYAKSCALIFVDGSHAYEYAMSDTRAAMDLLQDGGVIVWHDYGVWEGVTRALEELETANHYGLKHITGTSLVYWRKGSGRNIPQKAQTSTAIS
jgi:predicted O-methyltransferase YrrM